MNSTPAHSSPTCPPSGDGRKSSCDFLVAQELLSALRLALGQFGDNEQYDEVDAAVVQAMRQAIAQAEDFDK